MKPARVGAIALAAWLTATPGAAQEAASGEDLDALLGSPPASSDEGQPDTAPTNEASAAEAESSEAGPAEKASAQPPRAGTVPVRSAETAERKPSSRLVEEIVVTAQKREENLQDVPISINAFSADLLDARGVLDPKDLPLVTPGLTVGSQAGFTVTYLRGVGAEGFLLADPSVALYIDGIYYPFAHGQAQNFGAIERVEVLKGPQGTLFGRNAVGGAISVVSKAPSFEAPEVSLQTSYARYDNLQTRAHVNVPLAETVALSVSGIYGQEDDYRDGITDGLPLPGEVSRGVRAKLRWAPVDALDFTVTGFRLEQDGVGTLFATNSDPSRNFEQTIEPQQHGEGEVDNYTFFTLDNTVIYGQGTWFTDWFNVKILGGDQYIETHAEYDFDGSPSSEASFQGNFFADVKSAELQLVSNDTSWAADRFKWIAGYYYFDGLQGLDTAFRGGGAGLDAINENLMGALDPSGQPVPQLTPTDFLQATGILQTDSNSIFAQGTWAFTDWLSLTLGVRAQEEKRTIVQSGGAVVAQPNPEPTPYTDYRGQTDTTRSVAPKVSLESRLWDDGLVYASFQQAVKSSTFNVVNFLTFEEPQPVRKEELDAFEAGVKTTLFEGNTTLSAAAFYYDIKDIQIQFISLAAGGAVTFENAPAAEVKGVDFDLTSELLPNLVSGLVLTAGGAYVDAKFTDFPNGQGFDDNGTYTDNNDFTGKRIPRSPKFSGTVGLSQTLQIPGGSLELGADYYYTTNYFYLAQNTGFNEEKAYGVLGARISYLYERLNLRATLFGKNILDQYYTYNRFPNDFGALDAAAPPAIYGLRLNWDF